MKLKTVYQPLLLSILAVQGCSSTSHSPSFDNGQDRIEQWLEQHILAPEGRSLDQSAFHYSVGSTDLNHDGSLEHLVLIQDRYFCGSGGCTAVIFDSSGKVIHRMTVTNTPILLTDNQHHGWQDFVVWSHGHYRLIKYNGKSYPSNPSLAPIINRSDAENLALKLITNTELYQQDGYDAELIPSTEVWAPDTVYQFRFKHYGDPMSHYYATVNTKTNEIEIDIKPKEMSGKPEMN